MNKKNIPFNRNSIIFWVIILFTLFSRIFRITETPAGINQDEAMLSMDAWALSQYATDRFGTFLPVHFAAWKVSQMSVLLGYIIVPFIKVLGFNLFAIRLPLALISTLGIVLLYLISKQLFSDELSLAIMALGAINPWHFMQSRWALDCNLFPHIFLLAFYLLLLGLKKKTYLYLSMFLFGLTFYSYGIAIYTVPVFLFVFAAWCIWKKQLSIKNVIVCVIIFFCTALPEIITMALNLFGLPSIETPLFTMPYFPESLRSADILFMNFSFSQLFYNVKALVTQVFLQFPDHLFNTLPAFGPLYHISIPFIFIGIIKFTVVLFKEQDIEKQTRQLALWGFLIMGIWAGIITYEVNVNRINIIFYPLLILCGYGIQTSLHWFTKRKNIVAGCILTAYLLFGLGFFVSYGTTFATQIKEYFNADFLEITSEADKLPEYDSLYITGNMGWQYNLSMSEILTQYSCKIDALYYQEKANITGGQNLPPYSDRYHFINMAENSSWETSSLYIVHREELSYLPSGYTVILENDSFLAIQCFDTQENQ